MAVTELVGSASTTRGCLELGVARDYGLHELQASFLFFAESSLQDTSFALPGLSLSPVLSQQPHLLHAFSGQALACAQPSLLRIVVRKG